MKPRMRDGWQKINTFSSTEGCVDVRPRTAMAFCFWMEENLISNLTQNIAEPI